MIPIDSPQPITRLPAHIVEVMTPEALSLLKGMATAQPYAIISAPGAASALGAPWWRAFTADTSAPSILDCGPAAGIAALALRQGQRFVVFTGLPSQARGLRALAGTCHGIVLDHRPRAFVLGLAPYDAYQRQRLETYLRTPASNI
ncbi:hypothetical protein AA101099_0205 [Neoasaia chiangmaiensis NBRC 101099]|uniref:Uncharacterized protein n=1 Tax=Neoasaia chiangmaiensis TaxID=320497 RepID=A0A1U9KS26_9PROT|nr:hypothetical protein [Neoasaia chiangmaiensis]AQS88633.1 hypothetical protein A0U93_12630 [Neoasaia chiangmaiensis]GBR35997.1 hypothetical protein AA101099_0205 [Neoasaia chiangmaiensis NBRC 101099]GEN15503.1 hypothetical protein NCH01_19340 [Neoasaia chiangmaiensis]